MATRMNIKCNTLQIVNPFLLVSIDGGGWWTNYLCTATDCVPFAPQSTQLAGLKSCVDLRL